MVFTKDAKLPTYEELTVEEVPLGAPYLKAGAFHLGKYCETTNNEYMLCRQENNDPRYIFVRGISHDISKASVQIQSAVGRSKTLAHTHRQHSKTFRGMAKLMY